jgi:hypothetical protein
MNTKFDKWIEKDGRPLDELARALGKSRPTFWRLRKKVREGTVETEDAKAIEALTGGKVKARALLGV